MQAVWLVGLGGILGALSRYFLGLALAQRLGAEFPYATLVINVTGCFLLGLISGLAVHREGLVTADVRLALGVGFCGAYTTFSTFGVETIALLRAGSYVQAGAYVLGSNGLGLAAVWAGLSLARLNP